MSKKKNRPASVRKVRGPILVFNISPTSEGGRALLSAPTSPTQIDFPDDPSKVVTQDLPRYTLRGAVNGYYLDDGAFVLTTGDGEVAKRRQRLGARG